jgi:hypothetical protein
LNGVPSVFTGGFVGYAGYDTVRYVYSGASVCWSILQVRLGSAAVLRTFHTHMHTHAHIHTHAHTHTHVHSTHTYIVHTHTRAQKLTRT